MSRRLARAALSLYRWGGFALYPAVGPYLALRVAKGKEERSRRRERYGIASVARPAGPLVWFLRDDAVTDLDYWITLRVKARRMYVDITDPGKKGEPYDVRIGARSTDKGPMRIRLVGDEERFRKAFSYTTRPKSALLQAQDVSPSVVTSYQQAVPAGLHASHFDITLEKMLLPPFDFRLTGIELGYIPRKSRPQDDVSLDLGTDEPIDGGLGLVADVTEAVAE